MVDLKKLMAVLFLFGLAKAIDYKTYGNASNVTSFSGGFEYSSSIIRTATGYGDVFGLVVLGGIFLGFYLIGSRFTQERAFVYASFFTVIGAFILTSANLLSPDWMIVSILALIASAYFSNRVG